MVALCLTASLWVLTGGPSGAGKSPACGPDEVPWRGACFDRNQWDTDEKTCPEGVIVVPPGEDQARCVPCEHFVGAQQPQNYCWDLRANKTAAVLKETFEEVVKRFPDRGRELRAAQGIWLKRRDKACRAEEKEYEGGSMAPEAFSSCLYERNGKRIAQLKAMTLLSTEAAAAVPTCGGDPAKRTIVDRRASVRVKKSHLYAEAKACPSEGDCPWLRKGYLVRGDQVSETAVSGEFACVTFKATTGWLPLRDLCEDGAACDSNAPSGKK